VKAFDEAYPGISCSKINQSVATGWLGEASAAYEHTEISTLKAILKWAVDMQLLRQNPLATMRLSKGKRREAILSIDQHRRLVAATPNVEIRALLWFAWATGSRPSELRSVEWGQLSVDCGRAVLTEHKTAKQVGRPRVIYFPASMARILRKYRKPTGPVFLNTRGDPWTKGAVVCVLKRLRAKTGIDATAYAYRHSYATRALERGYGVAEVAEILGTSIEIISRNYAHLDKSKQRLAEIANHMG
jgi:integrase